MAAGDSLPQLTVLLHVVTPLHFQDQEKIIHYYHYILLYKLRNDKSFSIVDTATRGPNPHPVIGNFCIFQNGSFFIIGLENLQKGLSGFKESHLFLMYEFIQLVISLTRFFLMAFF